MMGFENVVIADIINPAILLGAIFNEVLFFAHAVIAAASTRRLARPMGWPIGISLISSLERARDYGKV